MIITDIENLLGSVKGTRFAGIDYVTEIKPAAKWKGQKIEKHVTANVQIFANLAAYTEVYEAAVKRSGKRIEENNQENIQNFEKSENWFEHDKKLYSIVYRHGKEYLFCIYNSVSSIEFYLNGEKTDKTNILQYLTPSEAKKLSQDQIVYNKKNDILHTVTVRTIKIENIKAIR